MSYAIFTVKLEAEGFGAEVDQAKGLPVAGEPPAPYPYGWTLHWAEPIEHPGGGQWAYPLDGCGLPCPSVATEVPELSPDWFPPPPWGS